MIARWLTDAREPLDPIPIHDVLRDSVYYPASDQDGDPVGFLNTQFQSFVYVDYGVAEEEVIESINDLHRGFRGYKVLAMRSVAEHELVPNGWTPIPPRTGDGHPTPTLTAPPFALWVVFERQTDFDNAHGPERFSLLYVGGDGVATYQALYHGNRVCPAVVAIIQPGTGFGGNWTDFHDPKKILARSVLENPHGLPEYLVCADRGGVKPCWPQFKTHVRELRAGLHLWKRTQTP